MRELNIKVVEFHPQTLIVMCVVVISLSNFGVLTNNIFLTLNFWTVYIIAGVTRTIVI